MSEEGTTTESVTETVEQPEAPKPTETVEFWKAKAREQEKKAKENAQARMELDDLKAAQLSNEERLAAERDQAVAERDQALTRLLVLEVATKFGITDPDDISLFLTGTDEETLTKQAERLAERTASKPTTGLHVPAEGRRSSVPALNSDELEAALKRKLGVN